MKMNELRIAVLGAGNIGGTLGRKWVVAGHKVAFGVTNPDSARAQKLRAELGNGVTIDLVAAALAASDVVVMALPGNAMDETIIKHAAQLDGRIIIDTANRMGGGPMNSFATFQTYTPQAQLYRAFNSLGWENFADPVFDGIQADLFYCGPDGDAREVAERMIADVGLRPIRLGDVEQVGLVDAVGSLWFALVFGQGRGRHLAFKVLSR
jgi:predicted dinucleotide-binding enzyme